MTFYLLVALLIAMVGAGLFFLIKGRYLATDDERRLLEAAKYTIIDTTPHDDDAERGTKKPAAKNGAV